MHELGIVIEVIRTVEEFVNENGLAKVEAIVLQIGELSSVIPKYVEDCYPAAADGTRFEDTRLEIEILPGNAICGDCRRVFNVRAEGKLCPVCGSGRCDLLGGKEFLIKNIVAC